MNSLPIYYTLDVKFTCSSQGAYMQRFYAGILNPIYKHFTCRIDRGTRFALVFFFIALMNGILIFDKNPAETHNFQREIIVSVLILLITVFSVNGELKPIKWNTAVFCPFLLFGFSILAVSFIHSTGLVLLAVEYIVLLPALYFVWINRGDMHVLFSTISLTVVFEGILDLVYCFILSEQAHAFVYVDRYAGNAGGPNQFGEIGVAIMIAGLFILVTYRTDLIGCILSSAGIGIGVSFVILSGSRTSMLAEMVCVLSVVLYGIKLIALRKDFTKEHLSRLVIALLLAAVVLFIGLQLDNIYYKSLQRQNEDVSVSALNDSFATIVGTVAETGQPEEQNATSITDRFGFHGDINSYSSGRIALWKLYIDNFAPLGKDDFWEPGNPEGKIHIFPAHNNIIEYTYRCGYVTGAVYLVLYIIIGVAGLRLLFGSKHTEYYKIFCIMCIGAFSVNALIEWAALLTKPTICMYYLSLAPIMGESIHPFQDS